MLEPLTWETYCEWRRTKCPQRDLSDPVQRDEEITQATLELVGEAAEVNYLVIRYDVAKLKCKEDYHAKLIDECGDCLFCACWVYDAWMQQSPFKDHLWMNKIGAVRKVGLSNKLRSLSYHSGILANKLKKQRYQGKIQDPEKVSWDARFAIQDIAFILDYFDSSISEALKVNIAKLEKRYSKGWAPGGGDRTGEG